MPDALTPAERTPGSWEVGSSLYDGFVACVFVDVGEQMKTLAEVRKYKDAVLFSAAPDLLEALRAYVDWDLRYYGGSPESARCTKARAAIDKAEGRSAASTARSQDGSRRDGGGRGT